MVFRECRSLDELRPGPGPRLPKSTPDRNIIHLTTQISPIWPAAPPQYGSLHPAFGPCLVSNLASFPALVSLWVVASTCLPCRKLQYLSRPLRLCREPMCGSICLNLGKRWDMLLSAPPSAASSILSVALHFRPCPPLHTPGNVEETSIGVQVHEEVLVGDVLGLAFVAFGHGLIITPSFPGLTSPELFIRLSLSPLDCSGKLGHRHPTCWLVSVSPSRRAHYVGRPLRREEGYRRGTKTDSGYKGCKHVPRRLCRTIQTRLPVSNSAPGASSRTPVTRTPYRTRRHTRLAWLFRPMPWIRMRTSTSVFW